jgi:hypothetical protein
MQQNRRLATRKIVVEPERGEMRWTGAGGLIEGYLRNTTIGLNRGNRLYTVHALCDTRRLKTVESTPNGANHDGRGLIRRRTD